MSDDQLDDLLVSERIYGAKTLRLPVTWPTYRKLERLLSLEDEELWNLTASHIAAPVKPSWDTDDTTVTVGKCVGLYFYRLGTKPGEKESTHMTVVNYNGEFIMEVGFSADGHYTDSVIYPPPITSQSDDIEDFKTGLEAFLADKVIVGHALYNDFKALQLNPKRFNIKDTSAHKPYTTLAHTSRPSLELLSKLVLDVERCHPDDEGFHESESAQAAMLLYRLNKTSFK